MTTATAAKGKKRRRKPQQPAPVDRETYLAGQALEGLMKLIVDGDIGLDEATKLAAAAGDRRDQD